MIAVLPSYQKIETGSLPNLASNEGFALNLEITPHHIAAAIEVLAFKQFLYLVTFNFTKPLSEIQLAEVTKQLFATHDFFGWQFAETKVAVQSTIDLLPSGFKAHAGSANLCQLNEDIWAAFSIADSLNEAMSKQFTNASVTATHANFLKQVLALPKGVYVEVANEQFAIDVLDSPGKLLLFNTFEYKTAEDFLYFLMLACDTCNVNRNETPLVFCGKIQKESKIYDVCYRYFTNIIFLKPVNGKFFAKAFSEQQKSIHFSLFSL